MGGVIKKLYIYIYICGAKGFRDSGPFHIKPKVHAKEEEMPKDEQKEPKLPGYTAENNPVLGRPKSRKGKSATSPEAIPSSILKEVPSPMG